jgi:CheY-like chemotaxis protein/tetratricopeptide (TPR) repeat protein
LAKQVLIIEDDESVAKIVAEACAALGAEAITAKTGADGLAKFNQGSFALLVLDILLPGGMDGLKVAEGIRAASGGGNLPIVVMSGFMKDPKAQRDLQTRYRVKTFLPKPLKPDDLASALSGALGLERRPSTGTLPAVGGAEVPARIDSFSADLRTRPVGRLFTDLYRGKAEGVLDLVRGNTKKRFYLQRGFFRYATSNVRAETLTGILPARGVPEARVNAATVQAKEQGIALTEALVQMQVVAEKDIAGLLTQQTEEVAATALVWTDGTATFRAQPANTGPEGRANPVMCVLKGFKRLMPVAQARRELDAQKGAVLERTSDFDRELFAIRALFAGEVVSASINGRMTVGELVAKGKDLDVQLMHALLAGGLVRIKGAAPTPGQPMRAVTAPARPLSTGAQRGTADEQAARMNILSEAERLDRASNHYQVLGVGPGADAGVIKGAYLRLARSFHVDGFSGLALGDVQPVLEEIFKRISEANTALGEPDRRAEYDVYLDRKAKGLPTDVGEVLQAEATYQRGLMARKAGRPKDAERLFRESLAANPGEASVLLELARTVLQLNPQAGAREARELLDKAVQLRQDFIPAMLLRGQLLLAAGDAKQALDIGRSIIQVQANNPEAMDLLRQAKGQVVGGGAAEAKGGGLLGKFFGGKSK